MASRSLAMTRYLRSTGRSLPRTPLDRGACHMSRSRPAAAAAAARSPARSPRAFCAVSSPASNVAAHVRARSLTPAASHTLSRPSVVSRFARGLHPAMSSQRLRSFHVSSARVNSLLRSARHQRRHFSSALSHTSSTGHSSGSNSGNTSRRTWSMLMLAGTTALAFRLALSDVAGEDGGDDEDEPIDDEEEQNEEEDQEQGDEYESIPGLPALFQADQSARKLQDEPFEPQIDGPIQPFRRTRRQGGDEGNLRIIALRKKAYLRGLNDKSRPAYPLPPEWDPVKGAAASFDDLDSKAEDCLNIDFYEGLQASFQHPLFASQYFALSAQHSLLLAVPEGENEYSGAFSAIFPWPYFPFYQWMSANFSVSGAGQAAQLHWRSGEEQSFDHTVGAQFAATGRAMFYDMNWHDKYRWVDLMINSRPGVVAAFTQNVLRGLQLGTQLHYSHDQLQGMCIYSARYGAVNGDVYTLSIMDFGAISLSYYHDLWRHSSTLDGIFFKSKQLFSPSYRGQQLEAELHAYTEGKKEEETKSADGSAAPSSSDSATDSAELFDPLNAVGVSKQAKHEVPWRQLPPEPGNAVLRVATNFQYSVPAHESRAAIGYLLSLKTFLARANIDTQYNIVCEYDFQLAAALRMSLAFRYNLVEDDAGFGMAWNLNG